MYFFWQLTKLDSARSAAKVSLEMLMDVSKDLVRFNDSDQLEAYLNLRMGTAEGFQQSSNSPSEVAYKTMKQWLQTKGDEANQEELRCALLKMGKKLIADRHKIGLPPAAVSGDASSSSARLKRRCKSMLLGDCFFFLRWMLPFNYPTQPHDYIHEISFHMIFLKMCAIRGS